jgi:hypothetical protein
MDFSIQGECEQEKNIILFAPRLWIRAGKCLTRTSMSWKAPEREHQRPQPVGWFLRKGDVQDISNFKTEIAIPEELRIGQGRMRDKDKKHVR